MSKRKNFNDVDLSFHLQHPGKGNEPGDPNAIFYLNGVYHLHYILRHKWNGVRKNLPRSNFPYNHSHSFIHCTSKDMLNWEWQKTKLQPSFTRHGMFSGTGFITLDKKPAIIYHGENTKNNYVIIAKNNELSKWNKPLPINKNKFKINFWDPDCFIINNTYYSISGGINPDLFRSKNLIEWKYVGKFMSRDLGDVVKGEDISCPNFFKLRNKWVLLCISHSHGCRYYIGDWDKTKEQFVPEVHERMNWPDITDPTLALESRNFFAPESVIAKDGRRVMWSWLRIQNIKNSNILSIPRELKSYNNKKLSITPLKELEKLRYDKKILNKIQIKNKTKNSYGTITKKITIINFNAIEIKLFIKSSEIKNKRFGFQLFSKNKNIGFPVIFEPESKSILVGSTKASLDFENLYKTENIEITIFIDHFLIEVFINNIQSVVGIYEKFENKNQINAYSFNGSFIIEKILIWKLKKINSGYKKAKKNKIWRVKEKI